MARLLHLSMTGLLLVVALTSPPVLGSEQGTEVRSLMEEGVAAFNRGDLEQALDLLEAARAGGLESPALRYNLGVLYYRIERYDLSRQAFEGLLGTRHDALARYNLGLVAQAQGRESQARAWFRQVVETAEQEKLRALAQIQLDESPGTRRPDTVAWAGFASLGAGYEDNLSLRSDSVASDLSDSFNEVMLAGKGPVLNLGGEGKALHASGSFFRRHYHSEEEFNSDAARLGLSWVSSGMSDRREVGLSQSYYRLGGESRELHTSIMLKYRQEGCGSFGTNGRCEMALVASTVTPFDGFEAYEGMRYLAWAGYRHDWDYWRASARLSLEFNEREDIAEGDQFVSVSPRRQELVLELDYRRWQPWTLGAELGYRRSDYPDPYRLAAATGVESGRRIDDLYTVELSAEYALARDWTITGTASYRDNHSSLNQYRYDNQIYQLSLDYLF